MHDDYTQRDSHHIPNHHHMLPQGLLEFATQAGFLESIDAKWDPKQSMGHIIPGPYPQQDAKVLNNSMTMGEDVNLQLYR